MYTEPTQAQPGTSIQQIHVLYSFAVDPDADINQDIHNAPEVESDTPPEDEDPSPIFPAISLHPLDGSFEPKLRLLRRSLRIGRQYDSRTLPTATNGFFDSKLLSRQHAKIWVHGGKMFIKDLGSANGTFLNGLRLSPSGQKSRRKEIHTDDILEFGFNVLDKSTSAIIHKKVSARVGCVLSGDDARREERWREAVDRLRAES